MRWTKQVSTCLSLPLAVGLSLVIPVTAPLAGSSQCGEVYAHVAGRLRALAARHARMNTTQTEKSCRAYRDDFYEAVLVRQAVSDCEGGTEHAFNIDAVDAEIEKFNGLIAIHCTS